MSNRKIESIINETGKSKGSYARRARWEAGTGPGGHDTLSCFLMGHRTFPSLRESSEHWMAMPAKRTSHHTTREHLGAGDITNLQRGTYSPRFLESLHRGQIEASHERKHRKEVVAVKALLCHFNQFAENGCPLAWILGGANLGRNPSAFLVSSIFRCY